MRLMVRHARGASKPPLLLTTPWRSLLSFLPPRGATWQVTHEAPLTAGFAAEIAATVQKECFLQLEAPVARVCGADTPFPLAMEKIYLPDELKVFDAIKRTVAF